jgi:hypothetical protein
VYTPTADVIGAAFDLGEPIGGLVLVRRGDTDTWRLETTSGSYFVKGYWSSTGGQFVPGGLLGQLAVAMSFEERALAAGIDLAEPVLPVDPVIGWVTRIEGRVFRVHQWIEHRALLPEDDIAEWLGRTMARVHRLQPLDRGGLPDWWRTALRPRAAWEEWFTEAHERGKAWSELGWDRLPEIVELTARISSMCEVAGDTVMTHGDFKTHNLLMTSRGPVLIDWDSVRIDSAALETGRVAHIFGGGELEPIRRILTAYVEAGGDLTWTGPDLFLGVARKHLHSLFEHVVVALGRMPAPRWMTDPDPTITDVLAGLSAELERLDWLAAQIRIRGL